MVNVVQSGCADVLNHGADENKMHVLYFCNTCIAFLIASLPQ